MKRTISILIMIFLLPCAALGGGYGSLGPSDALTGSPDDRAIHSGRVSGVMISREFTGLNHAKSCETWGEMMKAALGKTVWQETETFVHEPIVECVDMKGSYKSFVETEQVKAQELGQYGEVLLGIKTKTKLVPKVKIKKYSKGSFTVLHLAESDAPIWISLRQSALKISEQLQRKIESCQKQCSVNDSDKLRADIERLIASMKPKVSLLFDFKCSDPVSVLVRKQLAQDLKNYADKKDEQFLVRSRLPIK